MRYSLVELAPVVPCADRSAALELALRAAVDAEGSGYHRIWYAEHPGALSYASHDPATLIAAAVGRTSRIRLGSGAVLLNHHSPFGIAERYLMLEALAPGRIDLGLGRASSGPLVDHLLRRDRRAAASDDFGEQVQELVGHLHRAFEPGHPYASVDLTAGLSGVPEVWVLGSSGHSAALAGQLGIGYAFGAHINPAVLPAALRRYRDSFRATRFGTGKPQVVLAVNLVAADDERLAHELTWPARALRAGGRDRPIPTLEQARAELDRLERARPSAIEGGVVPAQVSGTTTSLREQLQPLVTETGATEIIVHDMLTDIDLRRRSRELVADALGALVPGA
ncbi:LLM class flavin-dependent oxidoreductase [Pseudonocardia ailaonensis]|uniref:LLM class flavin-dependent oxidoreductase n=1 Tax=Pseudonocardia ailaonensis TaxID=367279 RepID=A0ABN2NL22_9PSEU